MPSDSLEGRMMAFLRDVFGGIEDDEALATFMTGIVFGMGILTHAPDYASRFAEHLRSQDDPDMRPVPPQVILALEVLVPITLEPHNGKEG